MDLCQSNENIEIKNWKQIHEILFVFLLIKYIVACGFLKMSSVWIIVTVILPQFCEFSNNIKK